MLGEEWNKVLRDEITKPYFKRLGRFVNERRKKLGVIVYPKREEIFNAYQLTPYSSVKVVILGQDCYPSPYAHGLAFSSGIGFECPRSLNNILIEVEEDVYDGLAIERRANYDLTDWAKQGVFLLNTLLTVEHGKPLSHSNKGWERFTGATLKALNKSPSPIVFLLWGSKARNAFRSNVPKVQPHHKVLEAGHPSPLSVHLFKGCKHFSKTNEFLNKNNLTPIVW